ncbi:MAG: DUF4160 domain-containing protein [Rhizobiaceae bacterium]|nr:DUF4160 domain-containing protein [Rhizobiaceae bacterium]
MPTIFLEAGYRFHFYSGDGHEPPHVHVDGDGRRAKLWLREVQIAKDGGFSDRDLRRIMQIVAANRDRLLEAWNEHFR